MIAINLLAQQEDQLNSKKLFGKSISTRDKHLKIYLTNINEVYHGLESKF